ncbi:TatD family hydrolase [Dickeya zeae]|uniref:TatD family hydrolase n=1 Tax=Dickeya zeae TaxID=204042 RepID=UPI001CF9F1FE|nr:TatD family hydrolase [Dickeya zeae]UCZ76972.1 TatD family hydrolase [Dickeya zeae]
MFDIGVNLTSPQFRSDREQVVSRARQAGVTGLLLTGTNASESGQAYLLAAQYPDYCWSTAGVHPHDASSWSDDTAALIHQLAGREQVLAIAAEHDMPVFLHCRDAHVRFMALLTPWLDKLPAAVLHCFTGSGDELDECLRAGLMIGITGWVCDERRGLALRALLPRIPDDRLLLETDAPYLLPRDLHPKPASRRNEPCFLPHIVHQVALWRGQDAQWLGRNVDENARRIFRPGQKGE